MQLRLLHFASVRFPWKNKMTIAFVLLNCIAMIADLLVGEQ
jgi:hypothetical protein